MLFRSKAAIFGKRSKWPSWVGRSFPPVLRLVPEIGVVFRDGLCSHPNMAKAKQNKQREHRSEQEIVVDAYGAEERAMGWYCYLEERLRFPFRARCIAHRAISPLRKGQEVEVVGLAPADECDGEIETESITGCRGAASHAQAERGDKAGDPGTRIEIIDDERACLVKGRGGQHQDPAIPHRSEEHT